MHQLNTRKAARLSLSCQAEDGAGCNIHQRRSAGHGWTTLIAMRQAAILPATPIRLNALLRANPVEYERAFRGSAEIGNLICTINAFGLWFTLSNHLFIVLCVHTKRSDNNAASWTAFASKLFIVAALLQLLLMHKARVWYCRHRFSLAVANRLARLVQAAAMVLHSGFNATSSLAVNNSKAWQVLAGHVLLPSVLSLQASINFLLPANCTVFLQLLYVVISVAWHWQSPETMQGVPGVPELAGRVCTTLHGVFESVLSSSAAGAGVSSGPCSALGTAARTCSPGLVFEQLILYASFMVSYLVPLYGMCMAELHLKLTFWQKRQVQVELQRSVLLPLPEKPLLSNVLVLLIASVLLWFVAEQAAPYMAVTGAPIGGVCAG